jgi:hypothetical protein
MKTLGLRSLTERLLKASWWYESGAPETAWYDGKPIPTYNLDVMGPSNAKASDILRNPAKINTIVVHVTGVRGGFGVSKSRVKHWESADPPRGLEQLSAKSLALAERFRFNVPYHTVGTRRGMVFQSRDMRQRTYHAGPHGNAYVGCCLMDCHPNEDLSVTDIITAKAALYDCYLELTSFGDPRREITVIAHAQVASPARRGNDPGAQMWRKVVRPVCEQVPSLTADEYFTAGKGTIIPW